MRQNRSFRLIVKYNDDDDDDDDSRCINDYGGDSGTTGEKSLSVYTIVYIIRYNICICITVYRGGNNERTAGKKTKGDRGGTRVY